LLALAVTVLLVSMTGVRPVRALDVFTLWNQPEIPLNLVEGAWVEYQMQVMAGGRQETGLTRVVCLGRDKDTWLLELLPLDEAEDGARTPVPGEGAQLRLSVAALESRGHLLDAVVEAVQWRNGVAENVSLAELRNDPLVAASLDSEFRPQETEEEDPTTRVISTRQFLCRQFVMSAADTQSVDLPAGRMVQVTTREISAAVNAEIPFLGVAYAAERIRSDSHLDPPSDRMGPPPPRIRVEVMELVGLGTGATAVLVAVD
jgi:hypothetical protein